VSTPPLDQAGSSPGRRTGRGGDRRVKAAAVAAAVAAGVIVVVLAVPRIPPAWSVAWNTWDFVSGGVEDREKTLRDHPFPAALAPSGYRIDANEKYCIDEGDCLGWFVSFAGPDDVDTITFYSHAGTADEVYDYWTGHNELFGLKSLAVDDLSSDSLCTEQDVPIYNQHSVECLAAFDGMAVIAESTNQKPERGNLRNALTLLRAGVSHWESIRE
jgi:subtilisin family serine protease